MARMDSRAETRTGSQPRLVREDGTPVRVLVVDDEPMLGELLATALRYEGWHVECALTGRAAVKAAATLDPDVVVLDVMLPDMSGFDVLRRLREARPRIPVLFLTARDAVEDRIAGLTAGGDDYVTKPFSLSELVARVGALLRRARPPVPEVVTFEFADVHVDLGARVVTKGGKTVALTPREWDLLSAFIRHPRQVLARQLLLEQVWGFASDVTTRTIDIHVSELRRKLEDDAGEPKHFVTVWKTGYRFDP